MVLINKLKNYGNLVMFSHSIFSLPFGLLAMIFAYGAIPPIRTFVWILIALLAARNGANAFNRIADKDIDKKNPRTQNRDIPAGRVSIKEAYFITIACFFILALAAYHLNLLTLLLLPFALAIFIFYSYSKRITWLCHFILGVACGGAPVGAYIAITGSISLLPILLGGAVCFWIAGFDIIYATQDIEFDTKEKIHSVPSKFGFHGALLIARISHTISFFMLMYVPVLVDLSFIYYIGLALIAVLLITEHHNINPNNAKKMKLVSYSINQIISIIFFTFTIGAFFL